jgi:hypothetical protein
MAEAVENLVQVAYELQRLAIPDAVFVVVDVATLGAFYGIEKRLRKAGHAPDAHGPIGRWRIHGVPVDLIPASSAVLGFTNRWYRQLVDTALLLEVASDLEVRVATAEMFLATKLEAFLDRGAQDPTMSHDLTDIVSLVNGRIELVEEVRRLPPDARAFVQRVVSDLVADSQIAFVIHAHLPPDDASQGRTEFVLSQPRRLASS